MEIGPNPKLSLCKIKVIILFIILFKYKDNLTV